MVAASTEADEVLLSPQRSVKGTSLGASPKAALLGASASAPQLRQQARQVWIDNDVDDAAAVAQASPTSRPPSRQQIISSSPPSRPSSRQQLVRPGTSGSTISNGSTSRPCSRGSGRFSQEELNCFSKIPKPSTTCDPKSEAYWATTGEIRKELTVTGWHSLPVLKGKFYSPAQTKDATVTRERKTTASTLGRRPALPEEKQLPEEAFTAAVLEQIYPRYSGKQESDAALDDGQMKPVRNTTLKPSLEGKHQSSVTSSHGAKEQPPSPLSISPGQRTLRSLTSSAALAGAEGHSGGGVEVGTSVSSGGGRFTSNSKMMLAFRQRLIEKFVTVKEAHDAFVASARGPRQLTKKEWLRILQRHGFEWTNREEMNTMFELLDIRGEGHFSPGDLYTAVEAVVPVRTLQDLRRRWLATGFSCMLQALRSMEDSGHITAQRYGFTEFAEMLKRVSLPDHSEHLAIWSTVYDESNGRQTASVADLACAVATVSPHLLLEDLRERLLRKYNGNLDKAFSEVDMDNEGNIDFDEFTIQAQRRLALTEFEARKVFREIDADGSGELSRSEFVGAIGLTEPSLFLEDLRLKIRQRFQSIKEAFTLAFAHSMSDVALPPKLTIDHFQELLRPLNLKDSETKALFQIIDCDRSGEMTIKEFVRGVQHFAPSYVLEEIRLRCFQTYPQVLDAFNPWPVDERHKLIDMESFSRMLADLHIYDGKAEKEVLGLQLQAIFDLLDVQQNGLVSVGRLMAGLRTCGAGAAMKLASEDLNFRAKMDIRSDMLPLSRMIHDIKSQVRAGSQWEEIRTRNAYAEAVDLATEDARKSSTGGLKSSKFIQGAGRGGGHKGPVQYSAAATQSSWTKVLKTLHRLPENASRATLELNLQGYFEAANGQLVHDGNLMRGGRHSRLAHFEKVQVHENTIRRRV